MTVTTQAGPTTVNQARLERILRLEVPVSVTLAERDLPVEQVLNMTVGTILEFGVPFDADLSLRVSNQVIGHGSAVKTGENFGLRVARLIAPRARLAAIGR